MSSVYGRNAEHWIREWQTRGYIKSGSDSRRKARYARQTVEAVILSVADQSVKLCFPFHHVPMLRVIFISYARNSNYAIHEFISLRMY